ncbi:MAG TPA: HD domain-containing protein [Gemmatimonadaceae bacterium]|nr:HD domain-containing protein [Gemmatimonadaceae bacterium]
MTTGYSDRINHALAYAAKHHDQQVRRGTRSPYLTRHANVAVILTRYGGDDDTVVAGILHDVVGDSVRGGVSRESLAARVGEKFGEGALDIAFAVSERRADDDGIELSVDERREDLLERLARAPDRARWVVAADTLHEAGTLLADLRRTEFPESVWERSSRDQGLDWLRRVHERLGEVGFSAPIMTELGQLVADLERHWRAVTHGRPAGR